MQPYNGLLLVNKPEGYSSFGIVAKVRGILRLASGQKNIKVGHTGTLDPAATGLLVLAIGKYTKKMPELMKHDKTYLVEMKLGFTSTYGTINILGSITGGGSGMDLADNDHTLFKTWLGAGNTSNTIEIRQIISSGAESTWMYIAQYIDQNGELRTRITKCH